MPFSEAADNQFIHRSWFRGAAVKSNGQTGDQTTSAQRTMRLSNGRYQSSR
jgi:hypothetical protein